MSYDDDSLAFFMPAREPAVDASTRKRGASKAKAARPARTSSTSRSSPLLDPVVPSRASGRSALSLSPASSPESAKGVQPSDSQLDHGMNQLRQMAERSGWQGPVAVPPAPVLREPDANEARRSGNALASGSGLARSVHLPPAEPRLSPAQVKTTTHSQPAVVKAPVAPPENFWGVTAVSLSSAKAQRAPVGDKTRHLASLSTHRVQVEKQLPGEDHIEEDEIEELREDRRREGSYVSIEAKQKKRKADELQELKAKRLAKQAVPSDPFVASRAKSGTEPCAICEKRFPTAELATHSEACFEARAAEHSPAQPTIPAKKTSTGFRFAPPGGAVAPAPPKPPAVQQLVVKQPIVARPTPHVQPAPQAVPRRLEELFSPPAVKSTSKGKRRAVVAEDEEDVEEEEFADEFEGIWSQIDEQALEPVRRAAPAARGKAPLGRGGASAQRKAPSRSRPVEVIEIDDDDDLDDVPLAQSTGHVNSARRPGPPKNSSPPSASIYLSTLPPQLKAGYEHLYTTKAAKEVDRDEPQKVAPKRAYGGRGSKRRGAPRKRAAKRK